MTTITYATKPSTALTGSDVVIIAAPKAALDEGWHRKVIGKDWASLLDRPIEDVSVGDDGGIASTYGPDGGPRRLIAIALPDKVSRHNSPTRSEALRVCLEKVPLKGKKAAVIVYLDEAAHLDSAAANLARALPLFDRTSKKKDDKAEKEKAAAKAKFVGVMADGTPVRAGAGTRALVEAVRLAARLVDTPPQEMTTAAFEKEARAAVKGMANVKVTSIIGDKLLAKKMGGIHGVGRTAPVAPRLLILDYKPAKAKRTVALVGKGVMYDTGGLSLKISGSMSNMKCDMGGAAAVLGAFLALVADKVSDRVVMLACLAENSIGPDAYRPDDILEMHSGKTVEINNTDAEGRLVLADGVSYAARDIKADLIIDAATLTGAALITTGPVVSCSLANRGGLETLAVESGKATGDLTFPTLFLPEFLKREFVSRVADMRNSVKTRMNAQSAASGIFIHNHIEDVGTPWVHLDIAGPAFRDGRGTGYGVSLMREMVRRLDDSHLADD